MIGAYARCMQEVMMITQIRYSPSETPEATQMVNGKTAPAESAGGFHAGRLPLTDDELAEFHCDVEASLKYDGLSRLGETMALLFGERSAEKAMFSLLGINPAAIRGYEPDEFLLDDGHYDWRAVLNEAGPEEVFDTLECTQPWWDAAAYAGQGIAPRTSDCKNQQDREASIRTLLVDKADHMMTLGAFVVGKHYNFIWQAVKARAAIDFGIGRLSLEDLGLLSALSLQIVRNAVSTGALIVDADQTASPEDALAWLQRRRGFIPSRWLNPEDDQYPQGSEPEDTEKVFVPQTASGDRFMPVDVMRLTRDRSASSITVGAKGDEKKVEDFYEALRLLKEMPIARWRRPNTARNWGLVCARGPWISVDKAEIDRQIATKKEKIRI